MGVDYELLMSSDVAGIDMVKFCRIHALIIILTVMNMNKSTGFIYYLLIIMHIEINQL